MVAGNPAYPGSGTDLNPVAATDAKGRVWVAWQGFRNNNLEILAAAQNGNGFGKEAVVSFSKASDWDPSIATAANGEVAVAWDTYDKGDYDVYFRRLRLEGEIRMDAPVPVAATTISKPEAPSPTTPRAVCGWPMRPPTASGARISALMKPAASLSIRITPLA